MRVALVSAGYENIGVEYLSAALAREGHDVRLFFDPQVFGGGMFLRVDALRRLLDLGARIVDAIAAWKPDIVGLSCMTHTYQWSLAVARGVKARVPVPIIFGGIHPTSIPGAVLANECVDMVAVGESEASFCRLLADLPGHLERADVEGIWFARDGEVVANPPAPLEMALDSIPFPDKDLYFRKMPALRRIDYAIMASRGCPFSCSYCCNDVLKDLYGGTVVRTRSVDNVMTELRQAKARYGIRRVFFFDEIFPFDRQWLEEFSARYKAEIGLPFKIYFHFKLADEGRVALLRDAGCDYITFGLQSASERVRRVVCKRSYTNEEVRRAVAVCKAHGVRIEIDHIFGLPTETAEERAQAVEFYRELRPDVVYSYWLTYYPRTSIVTLARGAGLLPDEAERQIEEGRDSFYHKGSFITGRKELLRDEFLFDLVPLLPPRLHGAIARRPLLVRLAPKGYLVHSALVFLASLKIGQNVFANYLRLALSRKHVP